MFSLELNINPILLNHPFFTTLKLLNTNINQNINSLKTISDSITIKYLKTFVIIHNIDLNLLDKFYSILTEPKPISKNKNHFNIDLLLSTQLINKDIKDNFNFIYLFFIKIHNDFINYADIYNYNIISSNSNSIKTIGIIGSGTMGFSIASLFLSKQFKVILKTRQNNNIGLNLSKFLPLIKKYNSFTVTNQYSDLSNCDFILECASETLEIKKQIFNSLFNHIYPQNQNTKNIIISTCTSTLNLDEISSDFPIERKKLFLGLHFFSPVDKITLVELIKTNSTSSYAFNICRYLSFQLNRTIINVNNYIGFAANRIIFKYIHVAKFLYDLNISKSRIDSIIENFGFKLGPFKLIDLVGFDITHNIIKSINPSLFISNHESIFLKSNYLGIKTKIGYYSYNSKINTSFIHSFENNINISNTQIISDNDILLMLIYTLINEAYDLLYLNIVNSSFDIDILSVFGFGFPLHLGGLFNYSKTIDQNILVSTLNKFYTLFNTPLFKPSQYFFKK